MSDKSISNSDLALLADGEHEARIGRSNRSPHILRLGFLLSGRGRNGRSSSSWHKRRQAGSIWRRSVWCTFVAALAMRTARVQVRVANFGVSEVGKCSFETTAMNLRQ